MSTVFERKPEPTSFSGLRAALETDLDYFEREYLKAGEARPLRACLVVCYGSKFLVMRHGDVSAKPVGGNGLAVSWPVGDS